MLGQNDLSTEKTSSTEPTSHQTPTIQKDVAPTRNTPRSTEHDSSSWPLSNPSPTSSDTSYLPSDRDTTGNPYGLSRTRHHHHHRRSPPPALYPSNRGESSRSTRSSSTLSGTSSPRNRYAPPGSSYPPPVINTTPVTSATDRNHLLAGIMSRSGGPFPTNGSSGSWSWDTAGYSAPAPQPSSPDRRGAASSGRRRLRGVAAGPDSPTSSVAATDGSYGSDKRGEGGSAAGGSGASSSAGGGKLTEQNVSRTSSFYDYLGRERDREGDLGGSKGRIEALGAVIEAVGKKMGGGRK